MMPQSLAAVQLARRWVAAANRARDEAVTVRHLPRHDLWIANSGTDPQMAYTLTIDGNIAVGCECLAAQHGDPVCKHRAAFYVLVGALRATARDQHDALPLAS